MTTTPDDDPLTDLRHEIETAERRRRTAMEAGDAECLQELLSEKLVYGHSTGALDTRDSYLAKLRSGANVYRDLVLEVTDVVPVGNAALAVGTMSAEVHLPDRVLNVRNRFMTAWERSADGWRMVAHQTVALPAG